MDVDLKIRKIMQDYELRGDSSWTKQRLGGLYGVAVFQTKKGGLNPNSLIKIKSAILGIKNTRITSWKTRQR